MRGCSAFCRGFGAAAAAAAAAALLLCPLTVVNTEEPATAPSISPHESVPHAAPQPHQEDPVEPQGETAAVLNGTCAIKKVTMLLSGTNIMSVQPLSSWMVLL